MGSLIDRDTTRAREEAYPHTGSAALKQLGLAMVEVDASAREKYIDWIQELLKREDVKWAVKMEVLGGADPIVFGGSIPAVMMAKLPALGVAHGEISGGMTVSESNKATQGAKDSVDSVTNAGVGTAFWHVNEQLTVKHSTESKQVRSDDYRSRVDYKMVLEPMGEAEGIGLIKESFAETFKLAQQINQAFADAQAQKIKNEAQAPKAEDADKFMEGTDIPSEGSSEEGSDAGTQTEPQEESGE